MIKADISPLNETVAQQMEAELARKIDSHVETAVQNVFINRTGIARNRIFRIKKKVKEKDFDQEIRFSIPELCRIARELRFSSLSALTTDIEDSALRNLNEHSDETYRRRKSIELAALFIKLSPTELAGIREALELVTNPRSY